MAGIDSVDVIMDSVAVTMDFVAAISPVMAHPLECPAIFSEVQCNLGGLDVLRIG